VTNIAPFFNSVILTRHCLKTPLNNSDIYVSNDCRVGGVCQKCICVKVLNFELRGFDSFEDLNSCSSDKAIFVLHN